MSEKDLNELSGELDGWRARFEHARVQANLGKMELRDRLHELGERFEPAYIKAKKRLGELARSGATEARTLAGSLQSGWDELRRAHRELSEEAEQERADEEEAKRKGRV